MRPEPFLRPAALKRPPPAAVHAPNHTPLLPLQCTLWPLLPPCPASLLHHPPHPLIPLPAHALLLPPLVACAVRPPSSCVCPLACLSHLLQPKALGCQPRWCHPPHHQMPAARVYLFAHPTQPASPLLPPFEGLPLPLEPTVPSIPSHAGCPQCVSPAVTIPRVFFASTDWAPSVSCPSPALLGRARADVCLWKGRHSPRYTRPPPLHPPFNSIPISANIPTALVLPDHLRHKCCMPQCAPARVNAPGILGHCWAQVPALTSFFAIPVSPCTNSL